MAGQGSARVTLREIDLSQVRNPQQLPQGVPAAVVGPARKGPAFVPQTFANMQQFNEVFGNMLEVGREGNSNLFGPLALNEWMRSAQAGTYLRVLGVGNGLPAIAGKTTDAGFIVGQKQVQVQDEGVSKVGVNPHAAITNSDAALALGRTHFLGCFMKDSAGSSYLKDSGVQVTQVGGSLVISATELPRATDTIKIQVIEEDGGARAAHTLTFTADGGGADGNGEVNLGAGSVEAVFNDFKKELLLLEDSDGRQVDPGTGDEISSGTFADHVDIEVEQGSTNSDASAVIKITSKHDHLSEATNASKVLFNLNPTTSDNIVVGGKTASSTDTTFVYGMEGGSVAKTEITITEKPVNGATLAIHGLRIDNVGGALSGAGELVTYTFNDTAIDANGADGTDDVANRYKFTAANAATIYSGGSLKNTLSNLKAALDRTATTNFTSNHKGLFATSTSFDGLTLTVSQVTKGAFGNASDTGTDLAFDDANIELGGGVASGLSIKAADANDGVADDTDALLTASGETGFFFGGADGDAISFTMTLTGQPNDNDFLTLRMLDSTNDTDIVFENFVFETDGVTGTMRHNNNGEFSADALTFAAGTRNPQFNFISVKIGDDLQETLYNLKRAIRTNTSTI